MRRHGPPLPASSQLQSLPLFIKEQVGSRPPSTPPQGLQERKWGRGPASVPAASHPHRGGGLRSGLKEDQGTVGFIFTGGGWAGQGPMSQSDGSLSQKQGRIDPKDTGPSWLGARGSS